MRLWSVSSLSPLGLLVCVVDVDTIVGTLGGGAIIGSVTSPVIGVALCPTVDGEGLGSAEVGLGIERSEVGEMMIASPSSSLGWNCSPDDPIFVAAAISWVFDAGCNSRGITSLVLA